jgi:hypothetical protein
MTMIASLPLNANECGSGEPIARNARAAPRADPMLKLDFAIGSSECSLRVQARASGGTRSHPSHASAQVVRFLPERQINSKTLKRQKQNSTIECIFRRSRLIHFFEILVVVAGNKQTTRF